MSIENEPKEFPSTGDSLIDLLITGERGWYEIKGKSCTIYLEPRPAYCDRGHWYAKLDGIGLDLHIDGADGWPRYYFDIERARLELEEWLKWRKQWVEGAKWTHHTMNELEEEDGKTA